LKVETKHSLSPHRKNDVKSERSALMSHLGPQWRKWRKLEGRDKTRSSRSVLENNVTFGWPSLQSKCIPHAFTYSMHTKFNEAPIF
jgi:hypothetical protein